MTGRQIASDIHHSSCWQKLYVALFLSMTGAVLIGSALAWYWVVAFMMLSVSLYNLSTLLSQQPLHITAMDIDDHKADWQLLYKGRHQPVLWEAKLIHVQNYTHCIQFTFATTHPQIATKSVMIWQDQIQKSVWRRFKILAKWR